jgi:hypothetical protein
MIPVDKRDGGGDGPDQLFDPAGTFGTLLSYGFATKAVMRQALVQLAQIDDCLWARRMLFAIDGELVEGDLAKLYIIQPYREQEKCSPSCQDAEGHECQCSCMGRYHGIGRVSDTFATRWGDQELACRLLTVKKSRPLTVDLSRCSRASIPPIWEERTIAG